MYANPYARSEANQAAEQVPQKAVAADKQHDLLCKQAALVRVMAFRCPVDAMAHLRRAGMSENVCARVDLEYL